MLSSPSRQPISRPSVCSWIGVGAMSSKLPIIATPQLSRLNPPVWSPCHRSHQCAGPALEYLAVLVDDCVVGDVAPAQDLGVIREDRPHDRHGILRLVVVALGGVVDHRGTDGLVERTVAAMHRFVGAPLRARDDVGRLPGTDGGGRWVPLGVGRCLRRGNENRRDVLRQWLFRGRRDVTQVGCGFGLRRRRAGCAGRAVDRDLDSRGLADEDGVRAARPGCSAPWPVNVSVSYHWPHEPSAWRARIRAEVPVRSPPVSATMEKGVAWLISRTVTPPPRPISGCCARWVSPGPGEGSRCPAGEPTANGRMTTVAAIAVNNVVGAERRDGTNRCYVCV